MESARRAGHISRPGESDEHEDHTNVDDVQPHPHDEKTSAALDLGRPLLQRQSPTEAGFLAGDPNDAKLEPIFRFH